MNKNDITPLEPAGIAAATLTGKQREMLMQIIDAYSSTMEADVAADRAKKIQQAGADKITFAWAGETERGKKHYYRVQGPTFLIEFDNTQNDGNHVHSVWRDFNGDFGRDLLREHLKICRALNMRTRENRTGDQETRRNSFRHFKKLLLIS